MIGPSRYANGWAYNKSSPRPYSPVKVSDTSRAASVESDLFSYSSSLRGTGITNGCAVVTRRTSPSAASATARCSVSRARYSSTELAARRQNTPSAGESRLQAFNSSQLTIKIAEFLRRSDHVSDEWRKLGREEKRKSSSVKVNEYLTRLLGPRFGSPRTQSPSPSPSWTSLSQFSQTAATDSDHSKVPTYPRTVSSI